MSESSNIQHTSGLVAGPKPITPAAGTKLNTLDRFGTPLWIAVGISIVGLAVFAVMG